jgi:hypothetical protein
MLSSHMHLGLPWSHLDGVPSMLSSVRVVRDLEDGFWIGWLDLLTPYAHTTRDGKQYSAIADLHTLSYLPFTVTHSSVFVSWQRIYNHLTVTSNHIWVLCSVKFISCQFFSVTFDCHLQDSTTTNSDDLLCPFTSPRHGPRRKHGPLVLRRLVYWSIA